jgi:MerR family transcriptional regulator, light-induced transcriptional regulator
MGINFFEKPDACLREGVHMGSIAESASARILGSLWSLSESALNRQWPHHPGLRESASESRLRHMARDIRFHLEFLAAALWFEEPALLGDYAIWCKTLAANLNMPHEWMEGSFRCIAETLDAELPAPEAAIAHSYLQGALDTYRSASTESSSFILPGSPLGKLAQDYLAAVIQGERSKALALLAEAVDAGTPVRDIYLLVLQPVQREIGRLWQLNKISVAQEHYVTGVTQVAMAQLYGRVFTGKRYDRTLVAACVGGELHELGMRMIVDLSELDGWNTFYLGANTPNAAIIAAVRDSKADVLALSATMAINVNEIAEIIEMLRADEAVADTRVIVGGYPFNVAPELWQRVGADGYAPDAATAPTVAAQLAAGPGPAEGA